MPQGLSNVLYPKGTVASDRQPCFKGTNVLMSIAGWRRGVGRGSPTRGVGVLPSSASTFQLCAASGTLQTDRSPVCRGTFAFAISDVCRKVHDFGQVRYQIRSGLAVGQVGTV